MLYPISILGVVLLNLIFQYIEAITQKDLYGIFSNILNFILGLSILYDVYYIDDDSTELEHIIEIIEAIFLILICLLFMKYYYDKSKAKRR